MTKLEILEKLVATVSQNHTDIAPSYDEYMSMAFGIANDCGEAGRAGFHRLCALSAKYESNHADKLFDHALAPKAKARTRWARCGTSQQPTEWTSPN